MPRDSQALDSIQNGECFFCGPEKERARRQAVEDGAKVVGCPGRLSLQAVVEHPDPVGYVGQGAHLVVPEDLETYEQDAGKKHDALVLDSGQVLQGVVVLHHGIATLGVHEHLLAGGVVDKLVNGGDGEDGVPHGGLLHAGLGHHAGPELVARKPRESRGNDMMVKVKGAAVLGIPTRRDGRENGLLSQQLGPRVVTWRWRCIAVTGAARVYTSVTYGLALVTLDFAFSAPRG